MKKVFHGDNFLENIYQNNVWVIDDKFMTYNTILSDEEITKVIESITGKSLSESDIDRPDITILLNGNRNDPESKLDIVVVELKRLGITAEQNSIIEMQLETRLRKLSAYFDNRIQRMWFYGIVEFDKKFVMYLLNHQYFPLYSNGNVYYRSENKFVDETLERKVIQNSYIMDFKALINDADARNSTFLKILKSNIQEETTN